MFILKFKTKLSNDKIINKSVGIRINNKRNNNNNSGNSKGEKFSKKSTKSKNKNLTKFKKITKNGTIEFGLSFFTSAAKEAFN